MWRDHLVDKYDDATVAAVFRAALTLGIATPADLVWWVDEQVTVRELPAGWIVDLSTSGTWPSDRVCEALTEPARPADAEVVFCLLVGLIDFRLDWSFDQTHSATDWMKAVARQCRLGGPIDKIVQKLHLCFWLTGLPTRPIEPDEWIDHVVDFALQYADPAARAWLPNVRVRFSD